jgi:hypothetical protein
MYWDEDGLATIFIHGTWSQPNVWTDEMVQAVMADIDPSSKVFERFRWSGGNEAPTLSG